MVCNHHMEMTTFKSLLILWSHLISRVQEWKFSFTLTHRTGPTPQAIGQTHSCWISNENTCTVAIIINHTANSIACHINPSIGRRSQGGIACDGYHQRETEEHNETIFTFACVWSNSLQSSCVPSSKVAVLWALTFAHGLAAADVAITVNPFPTNACLGIWPH